MGSDLLAKPMPIGVCVMSVRNARRQLKCVSARGFLRGHDGIFRGGEDGQLNFASEQSAGRCQADCIGCDSSIGVFMAFKAHSPADSKRIAGIVGPTIVVMIVSEFPLVQPHLYDAQIPPVVYLSGVLMFVAGLAIVRAHNYWVRHWPVLVTLSGWFFLVLGLFRMFAAGVYQRGAASTSAAVFMGLEVALLVCGLVMTFKAYIPNWSE